MTKPDPLCKDEFNSRDRFPISEKPRIFEAYALGASDAYLSIKDNPFPETSGLHDAYEQGWQEHNDLREATP